MPQLERIGSWTKVPNGSRMRISVVGTTAENLVTAHPFVLSSDGFEQTLPDSMVQPGPSNILLEAPHMYSILVDLNFATGATAEIHAAVVTPAGDVFPQDGAPPEEFHSVITGTEGQIVGVTFIISTEPT